MRLHQAAWNSSSVTSCVRFCGCTVAQSIAALSCLPARHGAAQRVVRDVRAMYAVQRERMRKDLPAENFQAFARTALAHHAANGTRRTGAALVQRKERLSLDRLFVCVFVCSMRLLVRSACLRVALLVSGMGGRAAPPGGTTAARAPTPRVKRSRATLRRTRPAAHPPAALGAQAVCCEYGTCLCTLSTSKHHERRNGGRK
jgi:hypothetical protein